MMDPTKNPEAKDAMRTVLQGMGQQQQAQPQPAHA